MPVDSSTGYIPLDGSARDSCWGERSTLERRLIFLAVLLAVIVFTLSIAFAYKKCEEPHVTTTAPSTSSSTEAPTTPAPPNNSTVPSIPTTPTLTTKGLTAPPDSTTVPPISTKTATENPTAPPNISIVSSEPTTPFKGSAVASNHSSISSSVSTLNTTVSTIS